MAFLRPKRANSNPWGGFIIFTLLGAAFLVVPWLLNPPVDKSWREVTGTIVGNEQRRTSDGDATYKPIASFEYEGTQYRATTNFTSGSEAVPGSEVDIAFNPDNPSEARIISGTGQLIMYGLSAAGALVILAGLWSVISSLRRGAQIKNLKRTGQKVTGVLTDTTSTSRKYWVVSVTAQGPDGQVRTYKSDDVSGISSLQMSDYKTNPVPIDVYVNPMDPEDYYVDIDDIPQLSPERLQDLLSQTIGKGFSGGVTSPSNPPQSQPADRVEPPFPTGMNQK